MLSSRCAMVLGMRKERQKTAVAGRIRGYGVPADGIWAFSAEATLPSYTASREKTMTLMASARRAAEQRHRGGAEAT